MKKKNNFKIYGYALVVFAAILVFMMIWGTFGKKEVSFTPFNIEPRSSQIKNTMVENAPAVGWIRVQGTNIDYPVIYESWQAMKGDTDYTWVEHRPAEGENRLVIYGHNIRNISNQPLINDDSLIRFESLMSFVYEDFAKNNLYIQYSHDNQDDIYLIYAIGFVGDEEKGKVTESSSETLEYIRNAKENSLYNYSVSVDENDELLSLITCTRFFGLNGKKQFRVDARKIRENEKIDGYKVEKTANYDIIK